MKKVTDRAENRTLVARGKNNSWGKLTYSVCSFKYV